MARTAHRRILALVLLAVVSACGGGTGAGDPEVVPRGPDSDRGDGMNPDGTAALDGTPDSPAMECLDGPCCSDDQTFAGISVICEVDADVERECDTPFACGGGVRERSRPRHCSGDAAGCLGGLGAFSPWVPILECGVLEVCDSDGPDGPACRLDRAACDPAFCSAGSGPCCDDETETLLGPQTLCEEGVVGSGLECSTGACGGSLVGLASDRYCDGVHWGCLGEKVDVGWETVEECADHQRCDPLTLGCEDFTFHDEILCDGLERWYTNSCGVQEELIESCDDGLDCTQNSCHPGGCESLVIGSCDWPAEGAMQALNLTLVKGGAGILPNDWHENLSGAVWNPETETLWICRNGGPSGIWALQRDAGGGYSLATKGGDVAEWWEFGDLEGLTLASFDEPETLYLIVEGQERIKEVDLSTYGDAVVVNNWNTSPHLPLSGAAGAEGITFVPDEFLAAQGFVDGDGLPYTSTEGMGGLMLVGHQAGGRIYAFDLNHLTGDFIFVGAYETEKLETAGLEFDRSTGLLYIWHGIDGNYLEVAKLSSTEVGGARKLDAQRLYEGFSPVLFGSNNQEGIAILPVEECVDGHRGLFVTTDSGGYRSLLLFQKFPCDG